tara:strand:+ start:192 stop:710 length:519 start_codon:yes stop_codon:yes gene_type:complete
MTAVLVNDQLFDIETDYDINPSMYESEYDGDGWVMVGETVDDIASKSQDNISVSSRKRRVKRAIEEVKKMDPGYNAVLDKTGEKVFEFYETACHPGARIRDAITGIRDEVGCGTIFEDLYFKVAYCGNHGKGQVLFFSTPDDYERYFGHTIDTEHKQRWLEKKNTALKIINK